MDSRSRQRRRAKIASDELLRQYRLWRNKNAPRPLSNEEIADELMEEIRAKWESEGLWREGERAGATERELVNTLGRDIERAKRGEVGSARNSE